MGWESGDKPVFSDEGGKKAMDRFSAMAERVARWSDTELRALYEELFSSKDKGVRGLVSLISSSIWKVEEVDWRSVKKELESFPEGRAVARGMEALPKFDDISTRGYHAVRKEMGVPLAGRAWTPEFEALVDAWEGFERRVLREVEDAWVEYRMGLKAGARTAKDEWVVHFENWISGVKSEVEAKEVLKALDEDRKLSGRDRDKLKEGLKKRGFKASRGVTAKTKQLRTTVLDNHGNAFNVFLEDKPDGVVLYVEEKSGKTYGRWSWYLSTLLEGRVEDKLALDFGQGWYVTGMKDVLDEARRAVTTRVAGVRTPTTWEQDFAAAKKLVPEMDKVYDDAEGVILRIIKEVSSWNMPGLADAFVGGLKAGMSNRTLGFMSGAAKKRLHEYFNREEQA